MGVKDHTEMYIKPLILKKTFESKYMKSFEITEGYSAYKKKLEEAAEIIQWRINSEQLDKRK